MKGKSISHPRRDARSKNPEDFQFKGKTHGERFKKTQDSKIASDIYKVQREEAKKKSDRH